MPASTPEPKTPTKKSEEPTEELHVTVEGASDLLPAHGRDTCDAFVTVRANPLEKKNGRRTAIKHGTRSPVRGARSSIARARRTRQRHGRCCASGRHKSPATVAAARLAGLLSRGGTFARHRQHHVHAARASALQCA